MAPIRRKHMSDVAGTVKLGQKVPDFELNTYEPSRKEFGKFSIQQQREKGRWTILFFYPADFTFV
jgi:NADH-dependent peroxiredoxin subunit C